MEGNKLDFELMSKSDFIGQSNIDLEEIVLATLVNFPESYFKVADQLSLREFSTTETRYIYITICELSANSVIDIATVTDTLINKKYTDVLKEQKNGFNLIVYLNNICDRIESDAHLLKHVEILNGYAKRRELSLLSTDIDTACKEMIDPMEVLNIISTRIVSIQEMGDIQEFDLNEENKKVLKSLDKKSEDTVIVRSYITAVDRFIYCFENSELIILAAAPSMGKTAFALELFKNWIINDIPSAYFSLEMGTTQLLNRMYASESEIPLSNFRTRSLDKNQRAALNRVIGQFENKGFFIDDRARKLSHICNKIRKLVIRHGVKAVIVDYLQLMTCDIGKTGNRQEEVAHISRALKELASELRIPIIALSQINRAIHARSNKRPNLGDLRESGAIEQDADMVIFIHRPAYFDISGDIPEEELAEVIFAKGRSTGIGTVEVCFRASLTKFISGTQEEINQIKINQLGDEEMIVRQVFKQLPISEDFDTPQDNNDETPF